MKRTIITPLAFALAFLFLVLFYTPPTPTEAQENGWNYIRVSPESGHWNFPGYFVLEAERAVTVAWEIKCTEGGCDRPDEAGVYAFNAGESIRVGWGHQCYRWQLDPIGRTGFIAEAEPELCAQVTATPTATATEDIPTATPTDDPTFTPTPTDEPTFTPTPTDEPTFTLTPTDAVTFTPTPTDEPTFTPTPTDEPTFTPTPTDAPTFTPTPTDEPTFTPTPTDEPTFTPTPTDEPTFTPTPTATDDSSTIPPIPTPTLEEPSPTPTQASTQVIPETPASPTATTDPGPEDTPQPTQTASGASGFANPTPSVLLPVTGQGPLPFPQLPGLWTSLAAMLFLGLSGRVVWVGVSYSGNRNNPAYLYQILRHQARKGFILILLILLFLTLTVLPGIIRQYAFDISGARLYRLQAPSLSQEIGDHPVVALVEDGHSPALLADPPEPVVQNFSLAEFSSSEIPTSEMPISQMPASHEPSPGDTGSAAVAQNPIVQMDLRVDTSPVTRLVVPALNLNTTVQYIPFMDQTWDIADLGMMTAWLGDTSSPGMGSNTVLAAHITVGKLGKGPFHDLKQLKPGDLVLVYTSWNVYIYSVTGQSVVQPNAYSVVGPTSDSRVTLLTCTGWDGRTREYLSRLAVDAELVSVTPIKEAVSNDQLK